MKMAIAVMGYNRTDYFSECMHGLSQNCIDNKDLYFFLDGGESAKQLEYETIIKKYMHLKKYNIIKRSVHYGIGLQMIEARDFLFDQYDYVFILEDDCVLDPYAIGLSERLMTWANKEYEDVGIVTVWNHCHLSFHKKIPLLKKVICGNSNWITYLMNRRCWLQARPYLIEYKNFINNGYAQRNHEQIRKFIVDITRIASYTKSSKGFPWVPHIWNPKTYFSFPHLATSQDAMTAAAIYASGIKKISTVVNRCTYIGEDGTHGKTSNFYAAGFDKTIEHIFDEDTKTIEFEPFI